jgi:hypothetical protein
MYEPSTEELIVDRRFSRPNYISDNGGQGDGNVIPEIQAL